MNKLPLFLLFIQTVFNKQDWTYIFSFGEYNLHSLGEAENAFGKKMMGLYRGKGKWTHIV
jgi:hypothetical protein